MDRPTLKQLTYLVAVDEHRHFGKAAEACFVSQPALSAQIRELEKRLGNTLFERGNRQVLPTAVGARVIERARGVLRDMDELVSAARVDPTELRGPLLLGVIPTMAPYVLPGLLPVLTAAHRRVQLHLHELKTAEILRLLRDGGLDLGLLALPVTGDDLVQVPLAEDPFVLALPEGHPLAGAGPVPVSSITELPVILLEEGHCLREQALSVCRLVGTHEAEMQATGMTTLCQMVATGLGVTLLPTSAVALEARPGTGLTTRPFTHPAPSRTIGLVWRRTTPNEDHYRALAGLLADHLAHRAPAAAASGGGTGGTPGRNRKGAAAADAASA
ncbi:MAG TPA: LysR substrate-binding domain-containing protein [Acidimicrobiales bacterium]|nr:LysR substrate-binding domain-containing protein [Acidimicrobiales bacterium]